MVLTWIFFFFLAFGSKVVLALAMCYLIVPAEVTCDSCDAETLPVRMGPWGRGVNRLLLGTLQKRWCPACGWQGITRTGSRAARSARPAPAHAPLPQLLPPRPPPG